MQIVAGFYAAEMDDILKDIILEWLQTKRSFSNVGIYYDMKSFFYENTKRQSFL